MENTRLQEDQVKADGRQGHESKASGDVPTPKRVPWAVLPAGMLDASLAALTLWGSLGTKGAGWSWVLRPDRTPPAQVTTARGHQLRLH